MIAFDEDITRARREVDSRHPWRSALRPARVQNGFPAILSNCFLIRREFESRSRSIKKYH